MILNGSPSEGTCSVLLPILAMIEVRRGKKSVVRVAQRVAALVPVHSRVMVSRVRAGGPS